MVNIGNQSLKANQIHNQMQQRKRELQRQQHQKRLKSSGIVNPEQLTKHSDGQAQHQNNLSSSQKNIKEEGFSSQEQATKDSLSQKKRGGLEEIKQAAQSTIKGGSSQTSQQASAFVLNSLWGSLFTLIGFLPALLGLNLYFFASIGLLDIIFFGLSKKMTPFGILTRSLPEGLGKILGILVLFSLNLLALFILSAFFVMIIIIVTAIRDPWELIKRLPGIAWDVFKSLFNK
jgi:hypothetical protein